MAKYILKKICKKHQYPYRWVNFYLDGNPTNKLFFDVIENREDIDKTKILDELFDDLSSYGVNADHIEAAKYIGVDKELKILLEYFLNIKEITFE